MATVLPPPSKRARTQHAQLAREQVSAEVPQGLQRIQFRDADSGDTQGPVVTLSLADLTAPNLSLLLNSINGRNEAHERLPYRFYDPLASNSAFDYDALVAAHGATSEQILVIPARAEAVFRVRTVTRCSAAVAGHGESILTAQFSPVSSSRLATGSGDKVARIWDCDTGTPLYTLKGHTGWVLAVAWSSEGSRLATGSYDGTVRLWNTSTGEADGAPLKGHTKWVTSISWEPYHVAISGRPRLASGSKDGTVRVWDVVGKKCDMVLSGHKGNVSCVRWGGTGAIYTAGHDKTIKIWNADTGSLTQTLSSHAHWVNHLALSTDFALRTAYLDHTGKAGVPETDDQKREKAQARFLAAAGAASGKKGAGRVTERLVSASDDCTIYLWSPSESSKPVARLHGHQKQVNHVSFSPDGQLIASCGFDNLVKLWNARDGTFLYTLKGHVGPVYQASFSADSRLLVSASKDTTIKVWDVRTGKLQEDLPGHKDQVFAVDWSPDGERVASGGQDKQVRIWRH